MRIRFEVKARNYVFLPNEDNGEDDSPYQPGDSSITNHIGEGTLTDIDNRVQTGEQNDGIRPGSGPIDVNTLYYEENWSDASSSDSTGVSISKASKLLLNG
ncbi:unnamed protein product [Soboliphyme baturini]|uniref:Uncharacterized protein n=1 Tax=Soboliphyme baturini TaxID=241478 RepID=A0A183JB70_9BILA|nr:unnamed protein product [Soboliphyme baturini]